ncbi:MarR family winged helix-turn-helix transcriptional regulator [Cypionkella sp.]|uniref:MarR family winged helix-turn-helix transcriptional regulator n=1 Tax=Cypionkella sp. TaxID=2811411 RepID=UPI0026250CE7|nr:MarR family winged helix-turn-helix transcriptional regulator [Cypionkella sp.]MDB5664850.1 transcriptional regulator, MarR family [Cypionkella sp.]
MTDHHTQSSSEAALHSGCLNTMLRTAARRVTLFYDAEMLPAGLSSAQARLVAVVAELDDAQGQGPLLQAVAAKLGLEVSALTHALRPLIRDGVLTVTQGQKDGRTRHARLTADGAARLDKVFALYAEANRQIDAVLGADQAAELRRLAGLVLAADLGSAGA